MDTKKSAAAASLIKPMFLGEIAMHDPKLAYLLLKAGQVQSNGYVDGAGGWEIINIKGTWAGTEAEKLLQPELDEPICSDLWVRRVVYTVRRPLAFVGNILKAQSDYYNKLNPNIDFTLEIKSYCNYVIAPDFTPLENIETVFECVCPAGLILRCTSNMVATFINRTTLVSPGENVVISFHASRLPNEAYGSCSLKTAIPYLRERGFWTGVDIGEE